MSKKFNAYAESKRVYETLFKFTTAQPVGTLIPVAGRLKSFFTRTRKTYSSPERVEMYLICCESLKNSCELKEIDEAERQRMSENFRRLLVMGDANILDTGGILLVI